MAFFRAADAYVRERSLGFLTIAVLVAVVAAIIVATRAPADRETQVVAVVGIGGTLLSSLVGILAAGRASDRTLAAERERLALQFMHDHRVAERARIVEHRKTHVEAMGALLARQNRITGQLSGWLNALADTDNTALASVMGTRRTEIAAEFAGAESSQMVRARIGRHDMRDAFDRHDDAAGALSRLLDIVRDAVRRGDATELDAHREAASEVSEQVDLATLALAAQIERYAAGVDLEDDDHSGPDDDGARGRAGGA